MSFKRAILFFSCFLFNSCSETSTDPPYVGKWFGLIEDEYTEVHIYSNSLYPYTLLGRNRPPVEFIAKGDSIFYITYNMALVYKALSDSSIVFSNSDFTDTLFKLDKSIITYDEIDQKDSSALKQYIEGFYIRAHAFYNKLGYKDYWDFTKDDFDSLDEEIIIIK